MKGKSLSRGVHPQIWNVGRMLGVALRPVSMASSPTILHLQFLPYFIQPQRSANSPNLGVDT